ncbi:MAG: LuxR C-terminal-related transcriptional regulator, partial [Terrimicrobiaceae bacterium]
MKEIADELGMARNTLRIHAKRNYKKLHVHSRSSCSVRGRSDPGAERTGCGGA